MMYKDIETGEILTTYQLQVEYKQLHEQGETSAKNFNTYLNNCTSKNGTLILIKRSLNNVKI